MARLDSYKFRCGECLDHEVDVDALPSQVCGRIDCLGPACHGVNHCERCGGRMAKVFDEAYNIGRSGFVQGLNRNLLIDGKPTYVNGSSDMKRKFAQMSAQVSERRGYDVKFGTEWD